MFYPDLKSSGHVLFLQLKLMSALTLRRLKRCIYVKIHNFLESRFQLPGKMTVWSVYLVAIRAHFPGI